MVIHNSVRDGESLGFLLSQVQTELSPGITLTLTPDPGPVAQLAGTDLQAHEVQIEIHADDHGQFQIEATVGGPVARIDIRNLRMLRSANGNVPITERVQGLEQQIDFAYQVGLEPGVTLELTVVVLLNFSRRTAQAIHVDGQLRERGAIGPWATIQWWCSLRRGDFDPMNVIRNAREMEQG